jgi:hypothetical protein
MTKTLIAFAILLVGSYEVATAQEKRIRRDELLAEVNAAVILLDSGYFRYDYTFMNHPSSKQSMDQAVVELNDDWLENGGTVRNVIPPKQKDWGEYPLLGEKMRWVTYYDTTGLDVLEFPPRSVILPGEELSFSFEARGLPGIGQFWAAGWAPWYFTEEQEDSLIRAGYPEDDLHPTDDKFFKGITIVRKNPPEPLVHLAFLDSVSSYARRSAELGWLGKSRDNDCDEDERPDDGIAKNIELRLQKAKRELVKGDSVQTRKELEKLVQKVERIRKRSQEEEKKHKRDRWEKDSNVIMTGEAYALLKYNTQYLIERLPEKSKNEKDDKNKKPKK